MKLSLPALLGPYGRPTDGHGGSEESYTFKLQHYRYSCLCPASLACVCVYSIKCAMCVSCGKAWSRLEIYFTAKRLHTLTLKYSRGWTERINSPLCSRETGLVEGISISEIRNMVCVKGLWNSGNIFGSPMMWGFIFSSRCRIGILY